MPCGHGAGARTARANSVSYVIITIDNRHVKGVGNALYRCALSHSTTAWNESTSLCPRTLCVSVIILYSIIGSLQQYRNSVLILCIYTRDRV